MDEIIYGVDFGGSNLRIGKVNSENGKLVGSVFTRSLEDITTNEQLTSLITSEISEKSKIGISAAGHVDEEAAIITLSPNSKIREAITFGNELKKRGDAVVMTNDMKAAVQAAARYGEGKELSSVLLATYSSGFNCAVVKDGKNITTAEFGHIPYKQSGDLFCGCGEKGHLEIYVSGNGAATMAKQYFFTTNTSDHPILRFVLEDFNKKAHEGRKKEYSIKDLSNPEAHAAVVLSIEAKHVFRALHSDNKAEPQRSIRDTQEPAIADSFGFMNSAYNHLDIMILMGSQTKDWEALFEPAIEIYNSGGKQLHSLNKPKIVRTELPEIGVQGAVAYFVSQSK